MTPEAVLKAAKSIDHIDEIGTWFPRGDRTFLTLSETDPEGPNRDAGRLFLRLTPEELDVVIGGLLAHHEGILKRLGVAVEA